MKSGDDLRAKGRARTKRWRARRKADSLWVYKKVNAEYQATWRARQSVGDVKKETRDEAKKVKEPELPHYGEVSYEPLEGIDCAYGERSGAGKPMGEGALGDATVDPGERGTPGGAGTFERDRDAYLSLPAGTSSEERRRAFGALKAQLQEACRQGLGEGDRSQTVEEPHEKFGLDHSGGVQVAGFGAFDD